MVPEPSIASREKGIWLLLYCICGRLPEGNGNIHTHISREEKEKKRNGIGGHRCPRDRGSSGESSLERSVSFPERGCLLIGNTHIGIPPLKHRDSFGKGKKKKKKTCSIFDKTLSKVFLNNFHALNRS